MKFFIVLAHPEPNGKSFNHAMAQTAKEHLEAAGHEVKISDLYKMKWSAILGPDDFKEVHNKDFFKPQGEQRAAGDDGMADEIKAEQEKIMWCDAMIFQSPLYWFSMPAILKGWVDRVFTAGKFYGGGKWYDNGLCKGKRAMLSMTTGGPEFFYRHDGRGVQGSMSQILFHINHGMFSFVGFDVLKEHMVYGAAHGDDAGRKEHLEAWKKRLDHFFEEKPIPYPKLADFENLVLKEEISGRVEVDY